MFGSKKTTAERVAGQLELIKKVRAANSVWKNPYNKNRNDKDPTFAFIINMTAIGVIGNAVVAAVLVDSVVMR